MVRDAGHGGGIEKTEESLIDSETVELQVRVCPDQGAEPGNPGRKAACHELFSGS
jgi:hypothetical protein